MAQGQSTQIISMIKWIRTGTLSIKNSLSPPLQAAKPKFDYDAVCASYFQAAQVTGPPVID